jgi:hypothetical protein
MEVSFQEHSRPIVLNVSSSDFDPELTFASALGLPLLGNAQTV